MNTHSGSRLSADIAQNGIFLRRLAAATYGGSGFGGGGGGRQRGGLARRPDRSVAAAAAAGVAAPVVAGVAAGASPPLAAASSPPSPRAARRSRDRFSRCSGISVTRVLSAIQASARSRRAREPARRSIAGAATGQSARTRAGDRIGASRSEHRRRASLVHKPRRPAALSCQTATSSQTCGATTVRASVHERRVTTGPTAHDQAVIRLRHPPTPRTTDRDRRGHRQRDARHRHPEVAGRQRRRSSRRSSSRWS